jgi:energy-coupling factor transporter transmembrane protein EcfT
LNKGLFSYNNKKSPLHKIPALIKIVFTCGFCFFVFSKFSITKILISGIMALFLWLLSKSGFQAFRKLKLVLILGLVFTIFKGLSLKSPFFDFQLAKEGLIYGYNFFITTFVALILFETTTMLEIQNDFMKIPVLNKTKFPMILAITISFFPEIFTTWEEVSLAAKSRKNKNLVSQFSALISCMLQKADIKRKALLSRKIFG